MREFGDSKALEQAVKAAAQKTGRPVPKVIEEYWRSRLLARILGAGECGYVLKGGASILARIPDARRTRDLDIFAQSMDADAAISDINALAKQELGDFCRFDLVFQEQIQHEAAYRQGYRLKFQLHIGTRKVSSLISVDLVLGCEPTADIEAVVPKNIAGFPLATIVYPAYPLVDHIADKVCAIMEHHGDGVESSRVRDLVDLCIIACNESVQLRALTLAITSESTIRRMYPLSSFTIPGSWLDHPERYRVLAQDTGLSAELREQGAALKLVNDFINPALENNLHDLQWSPLRLAWESMC